MRTYVRSEIPRDFDPRLVKILQDQSGYLEQVGKAFGAIGRGAAPTGGGGGGSVTSVAVADHHKLSNLTTYDDHTQYLLLAGRKDGQTAYGAVPTLGDVAGTWTNGGNFTSKNSKTPTATWSGIAIDTSAAVGDVVILFLVTPTFSSATYNGGSNNHRTLTDSKGNTWTKLKEHQYSESGGTLNGPCHSAWMCTVTTALTAGVDTLTVTYASSASAMAITSHRWTVYGGTVALAGITSLGEQGFVGNEPSSLSLSALPGSVQYLFIRASSEGNAGTNVVGPLSGSTNYTAFNNASSFTSTGSGNVGTFGEYRILSSTSDSTDPSMGASGGYFVSIYLALAVFPAVTGGLTLAANTLPNAAKIDAQASKLYLYGHDVYFRDVATDTNLSYVRTSVDGAFVGPLVPVTLDDHPDDIFRLVGSSDATKKVAFEVDGLTTATTRTLTVPDVTATLLLSQGTSAGQVIGTGSHTGGSASDLVIEGRLLLGNALSGINFTNGRVVDIRHNAANASILYNIQPTLSTLTGTASGTLTLMQLALSGTPGYTAGSFAARGMFFVSNLSVPTGTTLTDVYGALYQCAIGQADGTLGKGEGLLINVLGASLNPGGTTLSELGGIDTQISNRTSPATLLYGYRVRTTTLPTSAVAQAVAFEVSNSFMASSSIVNWTGLRIPTVSGPTGTIFGLDVSLVSNRLAGLHIGTGASSGHLLEIEAGTTTRAPIILASGASLTSPVAGAIEFTTDDFFATITTGPARKAFVLDDGSRLTSGRVPFATTNGRLVDDSGLTFSAASGLTLTALNLITDVTTGMKIGTATNQKLGFWNAGPVIQPTTGITAATFVANTSGIADDSATFDGYTIGQVVAALRQIGLLA